MFELLLKATTSVKFMFELTENHRYVLEVPNDILQKHYDCTPHFEAPCSEIRIPPFSKVSEDIMLQSKILIQYITPFLWDASFNISQNFELLSSQEILILAFYMDYFKSNLFMNIPFHRFKMNILATTAQKACYLGNIISDLPDWVEIDLHDMSLEFLTVLNKALQNMPHPINVKATLAFKEGDPQIYKCPDFQTLCARLNPSKLIIQTSHRTSNFHLIKSLSVALNGIHNLKDLVLQVPSNPIDLYDFLGMLQDLQKFKVLHLDPLSISNQYDISRFLMRLGKLTVHSLTLRGRLESNPLKVLIKGLPEISSLTALSLGDDLSSESVQCLSTILHDLKLKKISLRGSFENAAVASLCQSLAHHTTSLNYVRLEGKFDNRILPVLREKLATFQKLTSLYMGSSNLVHKGMDTFFGILPQFHNLTNFGLSSYSISCHQRGLLMKALSQCPHLTNLVLISRHGDGIISIDPQTRFPLLKSLTLSDCYSAIEDVDQLISSFSHLSHLELLHFKDHQFSSLAHLKNLLSLKISGEMSDQGALVLAHVLEQMSYLNVVSISGRFQETGIISLVNALKKISHLKHATLITSGLEDSIKISIPPHIQVNPSAAGNTSFKSL